jgi:hypothetical protein
LSILRSQIYVYCTKVKTLTLLTSNKEIFIIFTRYLK